MQPVLALMAMLQVPTVELVFDRLDSLGPADAVLISFDFQTETAAVNLPMAAALTRHAFARNVPVLFTAFYPESECMIDSCLRLVASPSRPGGCTPVPWQDWAGAAGEGIPDRARIQTEWEAAGHELPPGSGGWAFEGRDYVLLGNRPAFPLVILGMASSIEAQYTTDMDGNALSELPVVAEHPSLGDVDLVVSLSASSACDYWILQGDREPGFPVALGLPDVLAPQYSQYTASGEIVGIIDGARGVSEYEELLHRAGCSAD